MEAGRNWERMMQERTAVRYLLNPDEVAEFLGMSRGWIEREVRAGRLQRVKLGRSVRFRICDLESYAALKIEYAAAESERVKAEIRKQIADLQQELADGAPTET
jgi:excisionase family DNA binding protein